MDAMRAKQKSEEKHVCLVFAILWECLARPEGCGQGAESWCDSALADLLASSCLLPALATYLVNDSSQSLSLSLEYHNTKFNTVPKDFVYHFLDPAY